MPRRRKRAEPGVFDPSSIVARVRGMVDPERLLEAEFARAQKDLFAHAEQDMTLIERIRFRIDLWKLQRRFKKAKRELLG